MSCVYGVRKVKRFKRFGFHFRVGFGGEQLKLSNNDEKFGMERSVAVRVPHVRRECA